MLTTNVPGVHSGEREIEDRHRIDDDAWPNDTEYYVWCEYGVRGTSNGQSTSTTLTSGVLDRGW